MSAPAAAAPKKGSVHDNLILAGFALFFAWLPGDALGELFLNVASGGTTPSPTWAVSLAKFGNVSMWFVFGAAVVGWLLQTVGKFVWKKFSRRFDLDDDEEDHRTPATPAPAPAPTPPPAPPAH